MATLTVNEVREFISDYIPNNLLIEEEEMTNTFLNLCMNLAVDSFNTMVPFSNYNVNTLPSKTILLYGTLWHALMGKAVLLTRNTLSYSDGGLQIPIEERSELYMGLSNGFKAQFDAMSSKLKIQINIDSGWGELRSDESLFPVW